MPTKAKYIFTLVVLLALAAGAVWHFTKEPALLHAAKEAMARVQAPYVLTATKIGLGQDGKTLVFEDLEFRTGRGEKDWTVRADRAEALGLNIAALAGAKPGAQPVADNILLRGVRLNGPGYSEKSDEYIFENISGDVPALLRTWSKLPKKIILEEGAQQSDPAALEAAAAFADAVGTLSIGKWIIKDTVSTSFEKDAPYTLTTGYWESRDMTARRLGAMEIKDLDLRAESITLQSKEARVEQILLPDFAAIFRDLAARHGKEPDRPFFKGRKIALEKIRLNDFRLRPTGDPTDMLRAGSLETGLVAEMTDEAVIKARVSFAYDKAQLGEGYMMMLMLVMKSKGLPLPPDISLSGSQVFTVVSSKDDFFDSMTLESKNSLGGVFDAQMEMEAGSIPTGNADDIDKGELRRLAFTVTDITASDLLLSWYSQADPQVMRATIVKELQKEQATLPQGGELHKVLGDCIAFIRAPGGTLSLSFTPSPPLRLKREDKEAFKKRKNYGLSSSFTPGKQP